MRAWEGFVHKLGQELGQETAEKWLHTFTVSHFDAGNLYLEARDSFHAMWFEEHIRRRALGRSLRLLQLFQAGAPVRTGSRPARTGLLSA